MSWLKKGPELKLPKLRRPGGGSGGGGGFKPPQFLADLYADLRDRRLLLPIALVVVAIAAVPFLLGGEDPEVVPPPAAGAGISGADGAATTLAVVEATPGLRDYEKRLEGDPSNPFKPHHTGLPPEAELKTTTSTSDTEKTTSDGGSGGGSGESGEPGSGGSGGGSGENTGGSGYEPTHFYGYRPNVRFGVTGSDELTVYKHLALGSLLPKEKPVAVFIGVSENGKRVAFAISDEVTEVRGPGKCSGGKQACSLLILRAGQAVDLVTGSPGRDFRLHVVGVDFIEVNRPRPVKSSAASGREIDAFSGAAANAPPRP